MKPGKGEEYTFSPEDLKQIQTLWADDFPEYKQLHRVFKKVGSKRPSGRSARSAWIRPKHIGEWKPSTSCLQDNGIEASALKWLKMTGRSQVLVYAHVCVCFDINKYAYAYKCVYPYVYAYLFKVLCTYFVHYVLIYVLVLFK